ncbi:MAG TPA: hypothetical protein DEP66_00145, partial [Acidimicrobiaceae bacterium]|nr:hypothetical protein [Acidimicrobiaceae bacterium]
PLAVGEWLQVAAGAVTDVEGNVSSASNFRLVGDDARPDIFFGPLTVDYRFYLTVDEDNPGGAVDVEDGRITLDEIHRDGVDLSPPSAIIYNPTGTDPGGGWVCLFGIDPDTAAMPAADQTCETDPDPADPVAPLAVGDFFGIDDGALIDTSGARSSSVSLRVAADFSPPTVEILLAERNRHELVVIVRSANLDTAGSAIEGSSVTFRAKTTSTAVPTATAFSAVVLLAGTAARTVAGAPAGIERTLCLLGLADGTPTPPASPCKAGSADDAPVPGDAFIVAGAIAGDTSNRRNRETVLVFADTTPPVVTLFLRENTSFVHLFYVGITEQYRAAGAAGRVDIGDFVRDGVPLAAPSAVLYDLSGRNDGGGTVCLFGIGSGRGGCVYNAGNTGVAPLADGEEIAALQGAVHDASGNPSARSDSVVVVDATGPEVSIRFLADSRNQLRVVVVEERPRSGSTIVAAEILRSVNGEERAPLGAPVEVYALPRDTAKNEQEFVVCLFGFAAGATDACSTDSTVAGSRALFQQDRFWVVVGAVYDSFDNPNREETGPVDGPDLTDPSVTVVLTANTNHQFVVTVHEEGSFPADADNRQVDIVEISRRGPAADAVATDLGAPSEIIPDGAAGGTVCLFGIDPATADLPAADQTCETRPLDPSDSGYVAPLSAGEVIVVGSGAVVDSAAKENDASASDAVGDVTLPVVTLAFDEENEYVLVISVTGASAGAVIAADRLFFNASPYTDTWSTAAADSGFTVVCLLGAAGPVVSAADCRTSADASPSAARLAPGDRFVILGGSVTDDAGNGNLEVVRAVAVAVVRVETVANADDRFVVYVEIAGGTGDYSSIPLEHITRGRPGRAATPLAAPSQFQSDSGVSRLLCLFGIDPATARLRPADRTCETDPGDVNDPDYVQPLSAGEVIRVLAGAIDSNEAASATVGDVTPPDVFVNFVGGNVHHFVVSVEETMLLEGQEIVAAEVLRGGVVDAHFVVERRSRNRWWVCVFGLTAGVVPDAAVNPDSPCATADPDGAGGATALTTGEEISVVTGAILDAAGNRSGSETGPFLVPDVVPPVVSVRLADGAGQTARFFVDVDESHPGRGELGRVVPGEIARDGVALGAPTAIIYDVSGSNPGGGEVCLFGITRASGTARCVTEVDALVAPLAEGSTLIVPGGALEDAGGAVSLASASVTVDFDFPPVLTVGISRGERAWFSVYVAEAIGLDAVGAAAGTPADVLSANELFVDGSRLTSPPVVVRNVGTGARAGLDWRVCLFGTVRGACRTQAGDAGGKAIKTGDTILVVAGALEDAAGNPSVAVTFTVPEYTPPVLNPKLQAGGARAGDDKVRFTLVEPNLASGSAVTVAEVKIRRGGNRLDLPDSANIVTARGIVIVCLLGLIPGHIANCIPFDGDAGNVAALTQVGDQYFVEHGAVCDVYGACSHESRPYVVTGDYRIPVPYVRAVAGQEYFEIGWVGPLGQPPANLSSTPHTIGVGEFSAQGRSTGAGLLYISQTDDGRLIRVCLFGVVDGSASRSPCKTADPNEGATPNLLAVGDVIVVNAGALANPAGTGSDELTYTVGTSPGAVNTAPVILTSAALGFDESSGEHRVTTLVATDADNDGLTWTKTGGADTVRLGVSTAGLLSFEDLPDFENPRDADRNNVYEVTVTVTDDGTPPLSAELAVRVTVLNADEAGTVRIMPLTVPRVGDVLTASVTDIDGSAADPAADGPAAADTTWQWERSTGTGYAPISGARAAAYTVMPFDAGKTLRAKAVYTDGHGAGKTGNAATATVPVEAVLSVVGDPVFTGAPPDGRGVTTLKVGDTLVLTVSAEQALAADSLADAVTVFAVSSVLVTLDLVAVAGAANTYRATYTVAAGHRVGRGDLAMNIAVRGTDGNALARFYRSFPGVVVD